MPDDRVTAATPRVAAGVLFTDDTACVLMLRMTYKDFWDIPGGYVEPGESPRAAAIREVREELGLVVSVGRMLAVDWAPSESVGDKLLFLFEGPRLTADQHMSFNDGEIAEARYLPLDDLNGYTLDRLARRVRTALRASTPEYLEHGEVTAAHQP